MLLELRDVSKEYPSRTRRMSLFKPNSGLKAVNGVNLAIRKGECVGLVGESGSGKSTLAKLMMNMEPVTSGQVLLKGQPIHERKRNNRKTYKQMQLVLQDSSSSLYPKMRVKEILEEPLRNYFPQEKAMWDARCAGLLELVDLDPSLLSRYPHQLSGGQKQRVCLAKALAVRPEIIILDESVASLDEPSQRAVLAMLKRIQKEQQLSLLFITHDVKSTRQLCDRVAIMYQGKLVETFSGRDCRQLQHPYSRLLFQAMPDESF
ncbi:ABC transporter ATP-binding protein [Domibacillus indicus]|uniref:ABC transporter ATP-binding protein n=1 Tax=Domibacillus indicus TaxID=1437523 RepID=UPI000617DB73|nr:ATP-binding cassette domain-containing protein [Domibacillus indicus]